jgi:hypothetical protein
MKIGLLVLAALVTAASGVAMVSAYEAHLINVRAHVENAMLVDTGEINFGTVFPQEWFTRDFTVSTSTSFCAPTQTRVNKIDYSIYVEWKPIPGTSPVEYYHWLGDALYIGIDAATKLPIAAGGNLTPVGPTPPPGPPGAKWVMDSSEPIFKGVNLTDKITVGLDVPVFKGYYNALSDVATKPSGLNAPTVILEGNRNVPAGITLGADIKIQVTNVYK